MENPKNLSLQQRISSLAFFDRKFFPLPLGILWLVSQWVHIFLPTGTPLASLENWGVFVGTFASLELALRRWPNAFESFYGFLRLEGERKWRAWSVKALWGIFSRLVCVLVLFALLHPPKPGSLGQTEVWLQSAQEFLGVIAAIFVLSIFCWIFLSLGEAWGGEAGGATITGTCLFLIIMMAALAAVLFGALRVFGKNA